MSSKISICIPTWEQHGIGKFLLNELLLSIDSQSYRNFNVIISDHSKNDEIKKLCDSYFNSFEIKYFKYEKLYGNGPANTNNSIINADGEIIKIMFQDDIISNKNCFDLIDEKFKSSKCEWLVCGCNHTSDNISFYNPMIPYWNEKIIYGINTISSPSVLSFKNNKQDNLLFDENLTMLMDCEYYYKLYLKYGLPEVINDILITNRLHEKQISSMYDKNIDDEIVYLKKKYSI
jgi:hypothetical protein